MTEHLIIPDTQVKAGVPIDHIEAAGRLLVDRQPNVVVVIGDWWDFDSLGSHQDRGNIHYHGKTYKRDYEVGKAAMGIFLQPLRALQAKQRRAKEKLYQPRLVFTSGNHEYRRNRVEANIPKLQDALSKPEDFLELQGFEVYPFKEPVTIDGITYCHFCPQTKSAGAVERAHLIMARRHSSWTVGHSQMLDYFVSPHHPRHQCIIAGAFYQHDEDYKKGSNDHWRGLIYKRSVKDGTYDPEFLSIDGLMELYR